VATEYPVAAALGEATFKGSLAAKFVSKELPETIRAAEENYAIALAV